MANIWDDITNPFIRHHLSYVADTEPPKIFHVWSAIACLGGCMGRHIFLETGIGNTYGNQYVLLVGPPGTRKNTAIRMPTTLMQQATKVRFAPDDTGGQRQGLITALTEGYDDIDTADIIDASLNGDSDDYNQDVNAHVMFVKATEFGSFLGQNSLDLTRFLIKMWDGEDYTYRLRSGIYVIKEPLLSMLSGTTPTDIATLLPPEAMGQGFMSRCILVYAPHKEKEVPPSRIRLDRTHEQPLMDIFAHAWYTLRGPMAITPAAVRLLDIYYMYEAKMQDTRFIYYMERRQTHLQKLAMTLAVGRKDMTITEQDVAEAHAILCETELRMPDALGEYGLSPVALAKQKMLEYLRYANEPISEKVLWAVMQRDMRLVDFKNAISALINANKIVAMDTHHGIVFMYKDTVARTLERLPEDVVEKLISDERGNSA